MATPEPSIPNYDESLILDSVDRFLERDVRPHVRELEENDVWPEEIVEKMKELGLFGATIGEEYGGIRPAPGYPACPDHAGKRILFDLLDAERIGVTLTESCAMFPAASVSGLYIGHPDSFYFGVGRVGRDQMEDYARRAGMSVAEAARWLGPNLAEGVAGDAKGARAANVGAGAGVVRGRREGGGG